MFSEPESWIGLRSERTIAGEFDAPVGPSMPRPALDGSLARSWRAVGSAIRRGLTTLLAR